MIDAWRNLIDTCVRMLRSVSDPLMFYVHIILSYAKIRSGPHLSLLPHRHMRKKMKIKLKNDDDLKIGDKKWLQE